MKQSVSEWTEYESLRLTTPRFSKKLGIAKFPRLAKIESEKQLPSYRKSRILAAPSSLHHTARKVEISAFSPRIRTPPTLIIRFKPETTRSLV